MCKKGRYREFNQMGLEAFGSPEPEIDVEIISLLSLYFKKLGLKNINLNLNSIGCSECRKEYNEKLKEYYKPSLEKLCGLCKDRYERNPLRLLDCKAENCKEISKNAPMLLDYLCDDCKTHFDKVCKGLNNLGIEYNIDKMIVRGLDYYTKTVFEFISDNVGTQGTVCGGGRYDKLVSMLGGSEVPATGFALGSERLLMELAGQEIEIPAKAENDIYIAVLGENAADFAMKLVYSLRAEGIKAETDLMKRSLKAQMKYANKTGYKYTVVIGDNEVQNNTVQLKRMSDGIQEEVAIDEIAKKLGSMEENHERKY
jgi:histidyl-tRNA synthetase